MNVLLPFPIAVVQFSKVSATEGLLTLRHEPRSLRVSYIQSLRQSSWPGTLELSVWIRLKTITNKTQLFLEEKMGGLGFLPEEGWRGKKDVKHRIGTFWKWPAKCLKLD